MEKLKDRFIDEITRIEYIKHGDYYLPNLALPVESTNFEIRKYGRIKLNYLKDTRRAEYSILLVDGKLNRYLHEIDIACKNILKSIISQMVKQENITEELKATNQMEWVGKMNSIKKQGRRNYTK